MEREQTRLSLADNVALKAGRIPSAATTAAFRRPRKRQHEEMTGSVAHVDCDVMAICPARSNNNNDDNTTSIKSADATSKIISASTPNGTTMERKYRKARVHIQDSPQR